MQKVSLILIICLIALHIQAQDITGTWNGMLKVGNAELRMVVNINKTDNGYKATMDTPDQGVKGLNVSTLTFEEQVLKFNVAEAGLTYAGTLGSDSICKGTFKQGGMSIPLDLQKGIIEKKAVVRPQEPTKPYPYYTEELSFENKKAHITLSGTLTLPKKEGKYPVVVLITGSGPQNRNEEILGHNPFLVWADYLTKNGIGVLRYDDRGIGQSTGDFKTATTYDFASDVEAALAYLTTRKDIDVKKIGLMGHSEGGVIAPLVASQSKEVNFIVLLAGTGIRGDSLMLLQKQNIERGMGIPELAVQGAQNTFRKAYDCIVNTADDATAKKDLTAYFQQFLKSNPMAKPQNMSEEMFINAMVNPIATPWMQCFIRHNPFPVLKNVKCPVLAVNGEKDLQVPSKINLEAIKQGLEQGGNKQVTIKEFPNLNHLFQECKTGLTEEYGQLEQTIAPSVLSEVSNWILKQVK
jgi:hypothetical protein